jgi:putative addiction module component (TIGR02574 family)
MAKALEEVTKEAMDLPPRQRLALAGFLLESADAAADPEAETAWDSEIRDRIRAIDEGRVTGVAYEDVMRAAERRLAP